MVAGTEFGRDTIEMNKKWWRTDLKFGSFKWNGAFYPKRRRFIYIYKKKRKTRTVSFWTTLFIFLLPPVWTATEDKNHFQNRPASFSSPPPPPNASMADQSLLDFRRTGSFSPINRELNRGERGKITNGGEGERVIFKLKEEESLKREEVLKEE